MQHLQPNTTLQGGKYRIERVLGQGGFGITYVGYNTEFEETVAIKEFFMKGVTERDEATHSVSVSNSENVPQFEEQRAKFKKEARRLRMLNNEHIVKVHDLFEENGTAYYVMEYIDGVNLRERLKATGRAMTESEVKLILPQILDALKAVHDSGMWHLDLKPTNIMLEKGGNIKLIDFGASKQMNAQKGGATTDSVITYTPGYAPLEQMEQNYEKFGPWTDLYALGATLYNLLTNKRPPLPTGIDDDISQDKHLALPVPDDISMQMKDLVLWLMQTNWKQRPQSVADVRKWLSTNSRPTPKTQSISTKKNTFCYQPLLAILIIGLGAYFYWDNYQDKLANEEKAFERLKDCNDPLNFEDFIVRFPNSKHVDEMKKRLSEYQNEDSVWAGLCRTLDVDALHNFVVTHPTSPYLKVALRKIDSLDWYYADKIGTMEAYKEYITKHKDGIYIGEALNQLKHLEQSDSQ